MPSGVGGRHCVFLSVCLFLVLPVDQRPCQRAIHLQLQLPDPRRRRPGRGAGRLLYGRESAPPPTAPFNLADINDVNPSGGFVAELLRPELDPVCIPPQQPQPPGGGLMGKFVLKASLSVPGSQYGSPSVISVSKGSLHTNLHTSVGFSTRFTDHSGPEPKHCMTRLLADSQVGCPVGYHDFGGHKGTQIIRQGHYGVRM